MSKERVSKIYSDLGNITQKWVDLLLPFLTDYSAKLSVSKLSRESKIPQQSASRYLSNLVKLNLLDYAVEGRNKLFYFDLKKQTTKIILNLIENRKALKFQLMVRDAVIIINEILLYCESLIVFGSYASNNFSKESDLDIVIFGKCDKQQINKLKQKYNIKVNEHYVSFKEFDRLLKSKNSLAIEILKNHVLFGDVSSVIDIFLRYYGQK